jgi:hypothetical protein
VNLTEVDDDAQGWVSSHQQGIEAGMLAVVTNAGFGGANTALVLA